MRSCSWMGKPSIRSRSQTQGDGTNVSGATLMPNARGLPGHNLHTWTGGWGTVTYWNAFVAVEELHGIGTFFDERFDDATQFPIAAAAKLGHFSVGPDSDQVTGKLAALHFYQLLRCNHVRASLSTLRRPLAGTNCSVTRPIATAATMSRYGRNRRTRLSAVPQGNVIVRPQ